MENDARQAAQTEWQVEVGRLRILMDCADELSPSGFVRRLREVLPGLQRAAMEAVIFAYINSRSKEEQREGLRQSRQT